MEFGQAIIIWDCSSRCLFPGGSVSPPSQTGQPPPVLGPTLHCVLAGSYCPTTWGDVGGHDQVVAETAQILLGPIGPLLRTWCLSGS